MVDRLKGKTALITGASRGIGRAIAEAYASEGANLLINARNPERLEQARQEMSEQYDVTIHAYACDVTDRPNVEKMIAEAEERGQIDILVNNAGIYKASPFTGYSFEDFKNIVEVNLYGVFHVTQVMLPYMIQRKGGRIINISSTAGKWGSRNQSAYNASKHAVIGLTRCLALEMAPHHILVNAICPWIVETDMIDNLLEQATMMGLEPEKLSEMVQASVPLKRWVKPEEVAHLAVYLGSDESSYISGQSWTVDGAYTMI